MRAAFASLLFLLAAPAGAQEDVSRTAPRPVDLPPRAAVEGVPVPPELRGRVTVVATPGATGIARALAERLPAERRDLAALLGREDDGPVEIRVGVSREDFQGLQPAGVRVPSWAAGIAFPRVGLVVVDAFASSRGGTPGQVLRHELAHVALGRLGNADVPRWFSEGFAQVHAGEWSIARSTTLARASTSRSLIEMDDLASRFPSSPSDVDLAYAQSASLVSYMAGVGDGRALHDLFRRLLEGATFDAALSAAFAQPFAALEVDWKRSVKARYGWVTLLLDSTLWWSLGAMILVYAAFKVRRRSRRRLSDLGALEEAEREARGVLARSAWLESQSGAAAGPVPLP